MTSTTAPAAPDMLNFTAGFGSTPQTARARRSRRPVAIDARSVIALKRRQACAIVDLRDWEVLDRTGWVSGSLHCPPGEFAALIDPSSPLHVRLFEPGATIVFYGGPNASPLAAARKARAMGLDARAMRGGLQAWRDAGGRVAGHPESALPALRSSLRTAWRYSLSGVKRRIARLKRRFA
ncbi:rhodanese-like domain-containing protein [Methylopila henanensis]|uniref:Rhodanese-like domain-containing protein n=1 Tax=Methylopila henanensis TaxID=873516 RepID=A0ABW4K0B0_9HYPH